MTNLKLSNNRLIKPGLFKFRQKEHLTSITDKFSTYSFTMFEIWASNYKTPTHLILVCLCILGADAERAEHPARRGHWRQRWRLRPQRCVLPSGQSLQRPPVTSLPALPLYVHPCPCPPHALPLRLWGHAGGAGGCDEAERPNGEPVPGRAVSGPPQWPGGPTPLQTGEWEEVPLHEGGNTYISQEVQTLLRWCFNI